jgi:hypothetical protein
MYFTSTIITIFFINVYVVLFLFNNVICVFLLYVCLCMTTLTEVFPCFFLSCTRQMPGWCPQRRGTARTLPSFFVALCIFCVVLYIFCVVLCDVCFVTFPVLFVCICVLNNCHRVATQLQLNISYHIIILRSTELWHRALVTWKPSFRRSIVPPPSGQT